MFKPSKKVSKIINLLQDLTWDEISDLRTHFDSLWRQKRKPVIDGERNKVMQTLMVSDKLDQYVGDNVTVELSVVTQKETTYTCSFRRLIDYLEEYEDNLDSALAELTFHYDDAYEGEEEIVERALMFTGIPKDLRSALDTEASSKSVFVD